MMSQPNASRAIFADNAVHPGVVLGDRPASPSYDAAEELLLLSDETNCAANLLHYFRNKTSENPNADLKAAFNHIDQALVHSQRLRGCGDAMKTDDLALLHRSMQHFQTVLSHIPQISFLSSRMVDTFLAIKDELLATRQMMVPVKM